MKFAKIDRFDLEEKIMSAWNIIEDIDLAISCVEDVDMSSKEADRLLNILIGIKEMYSIRFQKLFGSFEEYISYIEKKDSEEKPRVYVDSLFDEYESMLDKQKKVCDTDILKLDLTD